MDYLGTASVNHGLRCYHKTGYQEPDSTQGETTPERRRVTRFVAGGVEKRGDHKGLLYGSGAAYTSGKRLDSRSSVNCL